MSDFLNWLKSDCGYDMVRAIPGDRYVAIVPGLFEHSIIIGAIDDRVGCTDRWCYDTPNGAAAALNAWERADYAGEPVGWRSHPLSGRQRTQASWDREVIG